MFGCLSVNDPHKDSRILIYQIFISAWNIATNILNLQIYLKQHTVMWSVVHNTRTIKYVKKHYANACYH